MRNGGGVCRWVVLALLVQAARAQDPVFDEVPLRVVTAETGGRFVIDRGSFDRVEVGDRVVLHPRDGRSYYASVVSVTDRGAVIELVNAGAPVVAGSKGVVLVPSVRRQPQQPQPQQPGEPGEPQPGAGEPGAEPLPEARGGVGDDGWRPGMPLLGSAYAQKPEQRSARATGRAFMALDLRYTLETTTHSFFRAGGDVEVENLFGDGETLSFSGEIDYLTERTQNTDGDMRIYELSYAQGGTRFRPLRWQIGRFRQEGLVELGILDGVELIQRLQSGMRIGASLGYLPVLDDDMETWADLQFALFGSWSPTLDERLVLTGGFQKTWHRGETDRDLIVARADYVPVDGLEAHGNVLLDVYGSGDDIKTESVGITRAQGFLGSQHGTDGGWQLTYVHEEYPETLRTEFVPPVLDENIADAHKDLLGFYAFTGDDVRWRVRSTIWFDEEDSGGSIEVGREIGSHWAKGDRFDVAGVASIGLHSTQAGARVAYGRDTSIGRWDAFYELLWVHHDHFPSDRDDMLQHRLRALWSQDVGNRFDLSLFGEFGFWDDSPTVSIGCYLQRSF